MKQDGKLGRCHLKGSIGDQIYATLVAGCSPQLSANPQETEAFFASLLEWIKISPLESAIAYGWWRSSYFKDDYLRKAHRKNALFP